MKRWANILNKAFSKEEVQMTKTHMKKWPTSLTIKEVQIKTTSCLLEWLLSRTQRTNVVKDVGKNEPSYTAGRNVS
jgi:hypothetical protein